MLLFASLGYLFHAGAALGGDVSFVFNHIEDAIVQADEVDGRFLQFEGGLSITGNFSILQLNQLVISSKLNCLFLSISFL